MDDFRDFLSQRTPLTEAQAIRQGRVWYGEDQNGQPVPFTFDLPLTGRAVVYIDPKKFDAAFQQRKDFYVGPQGAGGIPGRYPGFESWYHGTERYHRNGQPVVMSHVYFDMEPKGRRKFPDHPLSWQVGFVNGRHRFAWMRDQGFRRIPVVVPRRDAADMEARFG